MRAWISALLLLLAAGWAPAAHAAEGPETLVALEVRPAPRPGFVPEALPTRFVLLEDGRIFVGGTAHVAEGRLEKDELKAFEKRLAQLRRMPGLGSAVSFGPGEMRYRLTMPKWRFEVAATGDPAQAPVQARLLSSLVMDLAAFVHPSLHPLRPAQYVAAARVETLAGGCRRWTLPVPLSGVLAAARPVPAEAVEGWPTGAVAASVCDGDRRLAVSFRPLLPVERP